MAAGEKTKNHGADMSKKTKVCQCEDQGWGQWQGWVQGEA